MVTIRKGQRCSWWSIAVTFPGWKKWHSNSNFVLVNFQVHVASHVARLFGALNKKSTKILWLCSSMVEFQSMIFVMGQTWSKNWGLQVRVLPWGMQVQVLSQSHLLLVWFEICFSLISHHISSLPSCSICLIFPWMHRLLLQIVASPVASSFFEQWTREVNELLWLCSSMEEH